MLIPKYSVSVWSDRRTNIITKFSVDDANGNKGPNYPTVAIFPISEKYPESLQQHHASEFATYMNKIAQATQDAYEANQIMDILKK